ncbi:MAG TPA: PstS family phosphate ABC transporter substrate-binding protein [Hyphomicrobiaceae bacterium]|nr:PstS family phosphate ABC transporter substrate-binding protein [Hyphomicrobiaceae bacterium]
MYKRLLAISAAAAALGAFVFSDEAWTQQTIVAIDGSSTVFPVTEAVAEEFQKTNPSLKVTVGVSGTGGGFKKFCRGETDISNASRPITAKEAADCKANSVSFIELPIALDALAVLVNPKNTWAGEMTVAELKKIWEPEAQGKIMNWKQVRDSFPDRPLTLFGAGVDSGTYDYFTAAIVGKEHSSRGDFTASEDDNVLVQGIAGDINALGFFGLAYYVENKDKLKAVSIIEKPGAKAVAPSVETALNGTYQPLSRPIFIYVNKKSMETKPHVKKFVEFYVNEKESAKLVKEVGYVPLPSKAYAVMTERVKKMEVGSAFGSGSVIGVSIDDLIKLPIKH